MQNVKLSITGSEKSGVKSSSVILTLAGRTDKIYCPAVKVKSNMTLLNHIINHITLLNENVSQELRHSF